MFKKEFPFHELKWSLLRLNYNFELISYICKILDVTCEVLVHSISSNIYLFAFSLHYQSCFSYFDFKIR